MEALARRTLAWEEFPGVDARIRQLKETPIEAGLRVKDRSFADIADLLNGVYKVEAFTKDNVQKRYRALEPLPTVKDFPIAQPTPYFSKYFDELGKPRRTPPEKVDLKAYIAGLEASGRPYKTLVLSDTQGVFAADRLVGLALDAHPDAELIVLPGDVCDWEGASKYVHDRDYPLLHEADWYVRLLEILTKRFPGVPIVVTNSNHRRRVENAVRSLPTGLLYLVNHNPEAYLAQPFAAVHAVESWWWQCGDAIYAHAEGRTTNAGDNAKAAIDAFINKREIGREGVQPFRLVLTGHSHKVWAGIYRGKKGIEPGCLASLPLPYTVTARTLKAEQENGYAVVIQRTGHADLNDCREFVFDAVAE